MTVNANDGQISITATGGETVLNFDFLIYAASDLIVRRRSTTGVLTTLVLNNNYTVPAASINNQSGGSITLLAPAVAGEVYTLASDVPETRQGDYQQAGDLLARTLNADFDRITRLLQQLRRDSDAAIRVPIGADYIDAQGFRIQAVGSPANPTDAASKSYVDGVTSMSGNVTPPVLSEVGKYLKAVSTGVFGWRDFVLSGTVTPEDFGALGDGITNDSAAFNAAIATGKALWLDGTKSYVLNTGLDRVDGSLVIIGNGARIIMNGDDCFIDFTNNYTNVTNVSTIAYNQSLSLGGTVTTNTTRLTLASAAGYAVNDICKIISDDLLDGPNPSANERMGEHFTISNISGSDINTYGPLREVYATTMRVGKLNQNNRIFISDLTFVPSASYNTSWRQAVIRIRGAYEPKLYNVNCTRAGGTFIELISCFQPKTHSVSGSNLRTDPVLQAYGYVIAEYSCEAGMHTLLSGNNVRHVYTTGCLSSTAGDNSFFTRGRTYFSDIVCGVGSNCQSQPWDTHADAYGVTFTSCVAFMGYSGPDSGLPVGIALRGIKNRAVGCISYGGRMSFNADFGSANNSRDNEYISCRVILGVNNTTQNSFAFYANGISGGIVTGIIDGCYAEVLDGGNTNTSLGANFANITVRNFTSRQIMKGSFTGRAIFLDNASVVNIRDANFDFSNSVGTNYALIQIGDATSSLIGERINIVAGSSWRDVAKFPATGSSSVTIYDLTYDTVYTAANGKGGGGGTETLRFTIGDRTGLLLATATVDFPNILNNASATANVTVTGAALGDFVEFVSVSRSLNGMSLTAHVSAANTVTLVMTNNTGGAVDLLSSTVRVAVRRAFVSV